MGVFLDRLEGSQRPPRLGACVVVLCRLCMQPHERQTGKLLKRTCVLLLCTMVHCGASMVLRRLCVQTHDRQTGRAFAMKVQKSAQHYTEAALDEIKLLKQVSTAGHKHPTRSALRCADARVGLVRMAVFKRCSKPHLLNAYPTRRSVGFSAGMLRRHVPSACSVGMLCQHARPIPVRRPLGCGFVLGRRRRPQRDQASSDSD